MSTQHTPGPWKVVQGFYPSFKEVSGASFKISCVMWAIDLNAEDYQKRDADLALIAAAPDLLEALKSTADLLQVWIDEAPPYDEAKNDREVLAKARAAIAKAEGVTA